MIYFDGHDLESIGTIGDPKITRQEYQPETLTIPGRKGAIVRDVGLGPASVSMAVGISGSAEERWEKLSVLSSWLMVDGPRMLVLPDKPSVYYMAVPNGTVDMERAIMAETTRITFLIADPIAYGVDNSVTVPSGSQASIGVGGTHETHPRVAGTVTGDVTYGIWGLRLDDGDFIHVEVGTSPVPITIDCETRTVVANGEVVLPTLDSDWLSLTCGRHVLANDVGSGTCTVTWTERWA